MISSNFSPYIPNQQTISESNTIDKATESKSEELIYSSENIIDLKDKEISIISFDRTEQAPIIDDFDPLADFLNDDPLSNSLVSNETISKLSEAKPIKKADIFEDSFDPLADFSEPTPELLNISLKDSFPLKIDVKLLSINDLVKNNKLRIIDRSCIEQIDRADSLNFKEVDIHEDMEEVAWAIENQAVAQFKENEQGEIEEVKIADRYADLIAKYDIKQIKIINKQGEIIQTINANNIKITKFTPQEINVICQVLLQHIQDINSKILEQQQKQRENEDLKRIREAHSNILGNVVKSKANEAGTKPRDPILLEKLAVNVLGMLSILVKKQREMERIKEKRAEEKDREFWENKHLIIQKYIQKFEILRNTLKEQTLTHSIALSDQNRSLKSHSFKISSH
ncbi:hypothetical protein [Candidatus Protochlamydia phocaeensis]|uniref:hypothetical protein n=1 Tax=Candidatus Protochlamydia phocaeensis TaxID=1414722 RepID=UPI00083849E6|nr:hypothetical protein [Candidatus Protochlamydia phocaeensis]